MHIIQVVSTAVVLILEKQVKYLLYDVVGIGGDCFFFYRQVHNSILLVSDYDKGFISLVSFGSSIIDTTSF